MKLSSLKTKLFVFAIFLFGFLLRIYNLSWDNHTHLHPDERFLTMVSTTISVPHSLHDYFDTATSSLNPSNYPEYKFFVYGTFPIFLTRFIGEKFNYVGYDEIYLLGRGLSAFFDSLIIIYLFFLARLAIKKSNLWIYAPSLFYAVGVLPLQLSHYYAVDTFLTSFLVLSFVLLLYFFKNKNYLLLIFSALAAGIAAACKVSAALFFPFLGLLFLAQLVWSIRLQKSRIPLLVLQGLGFLILAFFSFRIFQPYAFSGLVSLNPVFIDNLKMLQSQSVPSIYFPPAVQWMSKTKFIFPAQNIIFWGIGLPFCLLSLIALLTRLSRLQKNIRVLSLSLFTEEKVFIFIAFSWVVGLFFYQSAQFTYNMRYFLPIYPFIYLVASYVFSLASINKLAQVFVIFHLLWGLSFLTIYSRPPTRVDASFWIYQNIPAGAVLTNEYWDDPLPLYAPNYSPSAYSGTMLPLFDPDNAEKWKRLTPIIDQSNYMIMSSNRLWGSVPLLPNYYPQTSAFYQNLFDNLTSYRLAARFTSYPGFPLPALFGCTYIGPTNYPYRISQNKWFEHQSTCMYPGFYFRDDTADESFTVYDHPQVLIYKNYAKN